MLEVLDHFFTALCGQNPEHTWAPGGILLPCCQRCLGLYAGAAVAAGLHAWFRPRLTERFLEIHGAFLLLMLPLGFHWLPQGPVLRTSSGVLFGFGVFVFLWLPIGVAQATSLCRSATRRTEWLQQAVKKDATEIVTAPVRSSRPVAGRHRRVACATGKPWIYALGLAATLLFLPLLAAQGGRLAALALSGVALCGAAVLGALVVANLRLGVAGAIRFVGRQLPHDRRGRGILTVSDQGK